MKILTQLFDLLFPPRPTQVLVRTLTPTNINHCYQVNQTHGVVSLSQYQNAHIKALIVENKYFSNTLASAHLASLLKLWAGNQSTPIVFIPIPLSKKRERERGYNQVTAILEALKHVANISIDTHALNRTRHTTAQTSLHRSERLKNLTGAFICNAEKIYSYQDVALVIVDDVLTTGATMEAARAAISPHLNPTSTLTCLALAH